MTVSILFITALLLGSTLEFFVEPRVRPTPAFKQLVAGAVAAVSMLFLFLLSGRPVSSALGAGMLMIAIVVASDAKYAALREPLVFSDFALVKQVIKHPALYLPYVGVFPAILVTGLLGAAIWAALALEPRFAGLLGDLPLINLVAAGLLVASGIVGFRLLRERLIRWGWRLNPSFDPCRDVQHFGLFGSLLLLALLACDTSRNWDFSRPRRRVLTPRGHGQPPDIVALEIESFFDVRLMDPRIERSLLHCFDACARRSAFRGRLTVPAWGANTIRTEFAFLTGLDEDTLGVDRFNPYLRFAKRPTWSVAHELRQQGYQTICVHPFSGDFFDRNTVMPNLGFDTFVDIEAFQAATRFGTYVSDLALAAKIIEILAETGKPKFVFGITMENHGNWEQQHLPVEEITALQRDLPEYPLEFLYYLRHLANADLMIGRLTNFLQREGEGVLCVFGDHVPGFSHLFTQAGFRDAQTDYLVWRAHHDKAAVERDIAATELADILLLVAGLLPPPSVADHDRISRVPHRSVTPAETV